MFRKQDHVIFVSINPDIRDTFVEKLKQILAIPKQNAFIVVYLVLSQHRKKIEINSVYPFFFNHVFPKPF